MKVKPYKYWHDGLKLHDPKYPISAELTYKFFAGQGEIHCNKCEYDFNYDMWKEDPDFCIKMHYDIHEGMKK